MASKPSSVSSGGGYSTGGGPYSYGAIVDPLISPEARFTDSMTTASDDSHTTRSTVRTVNFREPVTSASEAGTASPITQSVHVEQLLTDNILIHHPRSLLILAFVQLAVAIQILIFGMICSFYNGCPYGTALWTSCLFILNAATGFLFLKLLPKKYMLYVYCGTEWLCLLLTIALFGVTAWLLDAEDKVLEDAGWSHVKDHLLQINRIIENTKIAMYTLHLVLAPIHGMCCGTSAIILCLNCRDAEEGHVRSGYYVSNSPMGHQTVLVPIELKQVKQLPSPPRQDQRSNSVSSIGVQT